MTKRIDRDGIFFVHKGDPVLYLWPWKRRVRKEKFLSFSFHCCFESLKALDAYWDRYYQDCQPKPKDDGTVKGLIAILERYIDYIRFNEKENSLSKEEFLNILAEIKEELNLRINKKEIDLEADSLIYVAKEALKKEEEERLRSVYKRREIAKILDGNN